MPVTSPCDETPPSGLLAGRQALARGMRGGESVRRCLVTGEEKSKTALIRFALDPAHHVVPDVAEKLPGRGLWVSALREALDTAVRKNLFARASKTKAKVDAGLTEQTVALLEKRCLEWLGLARGAGAVVTGLPFVDEALKAGELVQVLLAADAGGDVMKKMGRTPALVTGFTRIRLGEALGRPPTAVVGLRPHGLTEKLGVDLRRWKGVMPVTVATLDG